jgi:hypothetical protein
MYLSHRAVDTPLRPHFTPVQNELLNHRREVWTFVCHFSLYRKYCITGHVVKPFLSLSAFFSSVVFSMRPTSPRAMPAGSLRFPACYAKIPTQPRVANQLFRVLPSSNIVGAEGKLDSSSQWEKKGACQWNHSGQRSVWPATPAEHGCLSNALQFLIANLELEFKLSPKRISKLKFSNRKFMAIFQSENWAASEFRRHRQANSWENTAARQPEFLIATDDPTRIGILSDQRESKELGWDPAKILRKAESPNFLIATVAISGIESTRGKQTTKQISNSNKNAFFASRSALWDALEFSAPRPNAQIRESADA